MFRHNVFETLLSAAIALFAIGFLALLRWQTGTGSLSSYEMGAILARADGLSVGTDVKIAGVKVGRIADLSLEPRKYGVRLRLEIKSDIPIPEDSRLSVTSGIMSSPYLTISPGQSGKKVAPGGTLASKS
jgi:phospholipid/cholesterol/gamma-HCH transport system substrate-binding protein